MKRLIAFVVSIMLITTTVMVSGCGGAKIDPPVINVKAEEMNVTTGFVLKYRYPRATCKSSVDNKNLEVEVTAEGPAGDANPKIGGGYLEPKALGTYKINYNAKDKDKKATPAQTVTFTVTFIDDGAQITLSENAESLMNISDFTSYKVPTFDEIAEIKYDLHKWTNADFTSTRTASYKTLDGEAVELTEEQMNTPTFYKKSSTISIHYELTSKDKTYTITYDVLVQVGDILLLELHDRGEVGGTCTIEPFVDEKVSNDPIIKISAPFPVEQFGWPGAKLMAPSALFDALNENENNALVLNCYNPTQYWGKFYCSVYDDGDYTGLKGNFGRKYRVAPHSYFTMVVPRNAHANGTVNIMDLNIEDNDIWYDAPLQEGEYQEAGPDKDVNSTGWHGHEFYIISSKIVDETEYAENVWENNNMPLLNLVNGQQSTTAVDSSVATISRTTAEDSVQGLKVKTGDAVTSADGKVTNPNTYVDFLSYTADENITEENKTAYDNGMKLIKEKFADVHREHKYDSFLTFKVHNVKDTDMKVYAILGNEYDQHDWPSTDAESETNWLYELTIPANDSIQIYYNADTRSDDFDLEKAFNCVKLNTDTPNAEFVINDVQVINYPTNREVPFDKFEIAEVEGKHTEEALQVTPDVEWTIPAFETLFTPNHEVSDVKVVSITHRAKNDETGTPVEVAEKITPTTGYYDVKYQAIEKVSGIRYVKTVTFNSGRVLERPGIDKDLANGEKYKVPEFKSAYLASTITTASVKAVSYRADENAEFAVTTDYADGFINAKVGQYKVTYEYNYLLNGETKTETVDLLLTSHKNFTTDMFTIDSGEHRKLSVVDGAVVYEDIYDESGKPEGWDHLWVTNEHLFNAFNNSGDDCVLVLEGRNLAAVDTYAVIGQGDFNDENGEYNEGILHSLKMKANGKFSVVIPRNACMFTGSVFDIALVPTGKISITNMYIAYESDKKSTNIYDVNQNTVDSLNNDASVNHNVALKDNKLNFTSDSPYDWSYINILDGKNNNMDIQNAINNDVHHKVIAFEVTNNMAADIADNVCAIFLYCGNTQNGTDVNNANNKGPNNNYWRGMDFNIIKAGETRTFYITYSMLNHQNAAAEIVIDYLVPCLKGKDFTVSNFRVINFAN